MTDTADNRSAAAALAEKSDAVCRMGALMISAGIGLYRVERSWDGWPALGMPPA
ncbi:MAG: hypothetical protein IPL41_02455 [Micropruina sp.]|nr:hypothetical protein [Micropruina sp.]